MTRPSVTQQGKDLRAWLSRQPCPPRLSKITWPRIRKVLMVLCEHLPDPYPGIDLLAKRTGIPRSSVARYLVQAEDAGLIVRTPRGEGLKAGMGYTLLFLSQFLSQSGNEKSPSYGGTKAAPPSSRVEGVVGGGAAGKEISRNRDGTPRDMLLSQAAVSYDVILRHRMKVARTAPKRNRWPGPCVYCHQTVEALEGVLVKNLPAHRECDTQVMAGKWKDDPDNPDNWSREEAVFGERPEAPKVTTLTTDPAVRLARRFEHHWINTALKADPSLRGMRVIDTGPAVGYLRSKMLKHMEPEWVEAYIETFCDEAGSGRVDFKEGQSAWSRFTGWWGTVEIDDPIRKREDAALARRMHEAYQQHLRDSGEA
jgi:hypothetical protein